MKWLLKTQSAVIKFIRWAKPWLRKTDLDNKLFAWVVNKVKDKLIYYVNNYIYITPYVKLVNKFTVKLLGRGFITDIDFENLSKKQLKAKTSTINLIVKESDNLIKAYNNWESK